MTNPRYPDDRHLDRTRATANHRTESLRRRLAGDHHAADLMSRLT